MLGDYGAYEFVWVGQAESLESRLAAESHIPFYPISVGKWYRYASWRLLLTPFQNVWGIYRAYRILRTVRADVVFSKGGYVAFPVCIAAWLARIPVVLHESDTVPGLVNRITGYFARYVFVGFPEAMRFFPSGRTEYLGQILSPTLFEGISSVPPHDNNDIPTLLITGGSQGASRIFDAVLSHMDALASWHIEVILGTKNSAYRSRFAAYANVTIHDFLDAAGMRACYMRTDVAIARSSATTLAELDAFGIRIIMVPLPESGGDHQRYNAESYAKKGHILIPQDRLSDELVATLSSLHDSRKDPIIMPPSPTIMERVHRVMQEG